MQKKLSVIIPAYNEQDFLPGCLDSVLHQTAYRGLYEVVVIDNNSTDRTAAIARSKGVRVELERSKGYVHAIRRGVQVSRGSILAFIDADCLAPPNWVSKILTNFELEPEIVALGGKLDFFGLNPIYTRTVKSILFFVDVLPGNNMAIRRAALDQAGGFDPRINLSVDYWITLKLRKIGRIRIDRSMVVQTSGRRFQGAFNSHLEYFANVVAMRLLARPLFFDFPDVRARTVPER